MAILNGNEVESVNTPASLVYMATHEGEILLPFMKRSFLSFTYGGKHIEDFNLIATINNNRISRDGYANFDDIVTSYEVGQGQYYWGSHYRNNSITFNLSTDGMDLRLLDDFVWWFAADQIRELILAEHPNRAIMARVANPPKISLLPFEKKINVKLGEETYQTSTTNYKGEIQLDLVMDEPHWYSILNIFGYYDSDTGTYRDTWIDANGNESSIYSDKDAIKIAYEDGIPMSSMLQLSMLLGDNTYATVTVEDSSCTATVIEDPEDGDIRTETYVKGAVTGDDENLLEYYTFDEDFTKEEYDFYEYLSDGTLRLIKITEIYPAATLLTVGRISGPRMSRDTSTLSVGLYGSAEGALYFYYAGTAPAPVKLTFTLLSLFNGNYISVPSNTFAPNADNKPYNTIVIESVNKLELRFTTPGIYTAYNAAVKIFLDDALNNNLTFPEVAERIRDFVYHAGVRAWAMRVLDCVINFDSSDSGDKKNAFTSSYCASAASLMKYMFFDNEGHMTPATYMFNSKTGEAKGIFKYRTIGEDNNIPSNFNESAWREYMAGNLVESEENIGDMLKSNYLIIRDRNMPKDGLIELWSLERKNASHRFYHDVEGTISNVKIEYRNMYL